MGGQTDRQTDDLLIMGPSYLVGVNKAGI